MVEPDIKNTVVPKDALVEGNVVLRDVNISGSTTIKGTKKDPLIIEDSIVHGNVMITGSGHIRHSHLENLPGKRPRTSFLYMNIEEEIDIDSSIIRGPVCLFNSAKVGPETKIQGYVKVYNDAKLEKVLIQSLQGSIRIRGPVKMRGPGRVLGKNIVVSGDCTLLAEPEDREFTIGSGTTLRSDSVFKNVDLKYCTIIDEKFTDKIKKFMSKFLYDPFGPWYG